ncbi:heat shock 70 kDa protein 14-like isoform X3 [Gigantopelta aegis]|nr:heat shock 70 kDa protein 14-like isoform X3 [Gigantopelta aegis]
MGKTKQVSMTCIAETIYRKMLETAQSHGGRGIQDAVLTVPVGFTPEQRNAISDAAHKAGFNILRVVSEAAAAVLAYDLGQLNHAENSTVLVYRFGGTSTEATMIKVENGLYRVCASFTDPNFGADEYTRVLCDYLVTEFKRQFRCDVRENKRAMIKLWLAAEVCKHTMSNLGNAHCTIDSLHDGIDYHQTISRARFESLCSSLLQQNTRIIDQCLSESNLQKEDINKVILCGGGSKVPILQKAISDCLPGAELLNSIPADEVIAIGAAKEAAILVGKEIEELKEHENYLEAKCLSKSIYVKCVGQTCHSDSDCSSHQCCSSNGGSMLLHVLRATTAATCVSKSGVNEQCPLNGAPSGFVHSCGCQPNLVCYVRPSGMMPSFGRCITHEQHQKELEWVRNNPWVYMLP